MGAQVQAALVDIGIDNKVMGSNYVNSAELEQVAEQENECEQAGCENIIGIQAQTVIVGIGSVNTHDG